MNMLVTGVLQLCIFDDSMLSRDGIVDQTATAAWIQSPGPTSQIEMLLNPIRQTTQHEFQIAKWAKRCHAHHIQKMSVQYTVVAIHTHIAIITAALPQYKAYRWGTLSIQSPPQYATTPAAPATVPPKPVASSEFHFPRDSLLPRHWNHLCDGWRQRCPPF